MSKFLGSYNGTSVIFFFFFFFFFFFLIFWHRWRIQIIIGLTFLKFFLVLIFMLVNLWTTYLMVLQSICASQWFCIASSYLSSSSFTGSLVGVRLKAFDSRISFPDLNCREKLYCCDRIRRFYSLLGALDDSLAQIVICGLWLVRNFTNFQDMKLL